MFDVWHIGIPVRSLGDSLAFYVHSLGFEFLGYYEDTMGFVRPPGGPFTLEFIQYGPSARVEDQKQPDHIAFECADLTSFRESLLQRGRVSNIGPIKQSNNGMTVFSVKDPDGIIIQFYNGKSHFEEAIKASIVRLPQPKS